MYPAPDVTDFRNASQALTQLKINEKYIFCGMTDLEAKAQAVAEAYINNATLANNKFNENSIIANPAAAAPVADADAEPDAEPDAVPVAPATPNLTLLEVLHNYTMHIILATQLEPKIYKKIENFSPTESSSRFMATTVKVTEKHKHAQPAYNVGKRAQREDAIWAHTRQPYQQQYQQQQQQQGYPRQPTGLPTYQQQPQQGLPRPQQGTAYIQRSLQQQQQQSRQPQTQRPSSSNYDGNNTQQMRCYNCDKIGHSRKECKLCSFCKVFGHTTKECKKRITINKGKYCSYCNLSDSHEEQDCRKKQAAQSTSGHVRMVMPNEMDRTYEEQCDKETEQYVGPYDGPYDPPTYEEQGEREDDNQQY